MIDSYLGCPEQDSNLHASQHSHLKRARLPFRHLGNCCAKVMFSGDVCKCFGSFSSRFFATVRPPVAFRLENHLGIRLIW